MQSSRASVCRCVRYKSNVTASVGAGGRGEGLDCLHHFTPAHWPISCDQQSANHALAVALTSITRAARLSPATFLGLSQVPSETARPTALIAIQSTVLLIVG